MTYQDVYAVFALATQVLLVAFFAAHLLKSGAEAALGKAVYGSGGLAVPIAIWLAVAGAPWQYVATIFLYAIWSAFGATVDIVRPVQWREPPRWQIVIPYAVLLMAALLSLWINLWYVSLSAWVAFGVLYGLHTVLNLGAHVSARRALTAKT
jgi:hypothetical protein